MRTVLIAGFDSGLKYAARVADALEAAGGTTELLAPTTVVPHRLAEAQIRAASDRHVRLAPWDELVRAAAAADAVLPVFDGPTVERFIREVHAAAPAAPPVFASGYVGMTLYDLVGGYLMRSLADVVAINSRTDHALFSGAARCLDLPAGNLLLAGLALLPATPAPPDHGPIRTVVLADQPTVPRGAADRAMLWDRLLRYAELHPDRTVLLKPRHRPGEDTFHRMKVSPEGWAATRDLPPNLRIDHTPIERLLPQTDLMLTVSSTAALEAVAAGRRVAFIADRVDDGSLNPPLLPSGLLRRFDDIDDDRLGDPNPAWLDDVFPSSDGPAPAARIAGRIVDVVEGRSPRVHAAAWDSGFHITRRAADAERARLSVGGVRRYTARRVAAGTLRRALRLVDR